MSDRSSYSKVLGSSVITGGAVGFNYIISLVRIKLLAIILGPSGVGLIGLFSASTTFFVTLSGLGLPASAVREIATSVSSGNDSSAAKNVLTIRRLALLTGCIGALAFFLLSPLFSSWVLSGNDGAIVLLTLSLTILLSSISNAELAVLQGFQRIKEIAWANVFSAFIGTVLSIGLYVFFGRDGIGPSLLVCAISSVVLAYCFSRKIVLSHLKLSGPELVCTSKAMIRLGVAVMWGTLLTAALDLIVRAIVNSVLGEFSVGIYHAAWSLSGLFAGFVLSAMGTDFYPRLVSVAHDKEKMIESVNQQTEIGILLVLPGLVFTLIFGAIVVKFFYSSSFLLAADLLPWFTLGVFGRVISWPMGYILLARAESRWFVFTETVFVVLQAVIALISVKFFGLIGTAYTLALMYFLHTIAMFLLSRWMIGFFWSAAVKKLLFSGLMMVSAGLLLRLSTPFEYKWVAGLFLVVCASLFSLRGLSVRLGESHKLVKLIRKVPGHSVFLA
jgi:PST family polysaccharide transporter